jgi:branched-chain amino acid transport system ATP-binding protein
MFMLSVDSIDVFIKSSRILRNVSLEVGKGEVVCLIGRNGAGKTTTMRSIMGYLRPEKGRILFQGQDIIGKKPFEIGRMGIGYAPEDSGIFPDLTIHENIEISTWNRKTKRSDSERQELAYRVFPALKKYKARKGTQVSGGERKMLSIARSLALDPDLFILDEPFEGLAPAIVTEVANSIQEITKMGPSIIISESNIYHVPDFANRLYVIERGEIIFSGPLEEVGREKDILRIIAGTT